MFERDHNTNKSEDSILLKPISWRKSVLLLLAFPIGLDLTGLPIVIVAANCHFESND